MGDWYKIEMPFAEAVVGGKGMRLQDAFSKIVIARAGNKPKVAMFANHDDNNYETMFYYFSPDAVALAKPLIESYGGVICQPPKRNQAALCVGQSGIRDMLLQD